MDISFKSPQQQVLILHTLGLFKGSLTRDFQIQVFSLISGSLSTPLGQFQIFLKHITGVIVTGDNCSLVSLSLVSVSTTPAITANP
jgi:hypothetical protein